MSFSLIIVTALAATSAMTLWSHLVGKLLEQEYNEAQILAEIFQDKWGDQAVPYGWSLHYGLGLVMTIWLWFMYSQSGMAKDFFVGGWFGLLAGVIGVVAWAVLFHLKHRPDATGLPGFYLQLLGGHALFGILSYLLFHYWS